MTRHIAGSTIVLSKNSAMSVDQKTGFEQSPLGTKDYWDARYASERQFFKDTGEEGTVWFGQVAEERIMTFITQSAQIDKSARIADLGCGNGSLLRRLSAAGYENLHGFDYSSDAIMLAREIDCSSRIQYEIANLIDAEMSVVARFDVIIDKGTYDAISLSDNAAKSLENYRHSIVRLFDAQSSRKELFFVIVSCNFTTEELTTALTSQRLHFHVELPANNKFTFGGKCGSSMTCVVFKYNR